MANHFSALKRARQTTKRTEDNRSNTSRLRTALRKLREVAMWANVAITRQPDGAPRS